VAMPTDNLGLPASVPPRDTAVVVYGRTFCFLAWRGIVRRMVGRQPSGRFGSPLLRLGHRTDDGARAGLARRQLENGNALECGSRGQ